MEKSFGHESLGNTETKDIGMELQEGTYSATGRSVEIRETDSGAVMLYFTFELEDGSLVKASQCLALKDKTLSSIAVNMLRSCFGFTGDNPFVLVDDQSQIQKPVELVVGTEMYKGQPKTAVRFINPPGGGSYGKPVDRKTFLNRFGAQLRAMQGGTAAKPSAAPKAAPKAPTNPAPPAAPPKPKAPTKPAPKPATMDEAWVALCNQNPESPEEKLHQMWADALEKVKPGHQNDLSPEEWGKVVEVVTDDIPY